MQFSSGTNFCFNLFILAFHLEILAGLTNSVAVKVLLGVQFTGIGLCQCKCCFLPIVLRTVCITAIFVVCYWLGMSLVLIPRQG